MNIVPSSNCIICLEESTISDSKNGLLPLPCHCKGFIHKNCFRKLNSHYCLICKHPNQYSNSNISLQKISKKFREIEIKVVSSSIEVNLEDNARLNNDTGIISSKLASLKKCICNTRRKLAHNIDLFYRKNSNLHLYVGKIISDLLCLLLIFTLEVLFISLLATIVYFTGYIVISALLFLLFQIPYQLSINVGLILLNIMIGICCCSCCVLGKIK